MYDFTKRSKKVLEVYAQSEGRRLNSDSLGPEHIFLALLKDDDSVAARILKSLASISTAQKKKNIDRKSGSTSSSAMFDKLRYNKIIETPARRPEGSRTTISHRAPFDAIFKDGTSPNRRLLNPESNTACCARRYQDLAYSRCRDRRKDRRNRRPPRSRIRQTSPACGEDARPVVGGKESTRYPLLSRKTKNNPLSARRRGKPQ
jgi:ATP-dependent Clp protease ATP-binding subunit ClpA